jgi:hypothetical protein
VAAPLEAAYALFPALTSADIVRWSELAIEILTEPDPTASMSDSERLFAPLNGVQRKYSSILREGVADGLALVGQAAAVGIGNQPGAEVVNGIVRDLYSSQDLEQEKTAWHILAPYLQRIAEGAPEAFLHYVERDLGRLDPILREFFDNDTQSTGIFGGTSPHVYVLWALELLGQSSDYFFQVAEDLSRLTPFDDALGNTRNRAAESLRVLLLPWIRQTSAPLATRLSFLRSWKSRDDENAWPILLKLLPGGHDFVVSAAAPKYRDWGPQQTTVPLAEWSEFVEKLGDIVLESAGTNLKKWADLVELLSSLPGALRSSFFSQLEAAIASSLPSAGEEHQDKLYKALKETIGRHQEFPEADWALGEEELARLESAFSLLTPSAPANRYGHLFGWHPRLEGFGRFSKTEAERAAYDSALERQRQEALRSTAEQGIEALRVLVQAAENPHYLGMMLADDLDLVELKTVLEWLDDSNSSTAKAASGYLLRRSQSGDLDWVYEVLQSNIGETRTDQFASSLAPRPTIWRILEEVGSIHPHWGTLNLYAVAPEDRPEAISALVDAGRAEEALTLVELCLEHEPKQDLENDFILGVIRALLEENRTEPLQSHTGYALSTILERLRDHGVGDDTLAPLEFVLFRVLDHTTPGTPSLFKLLETEPESFANLVETAFIAKSSALGAEIKSANPGRAALAYEVLSKWRTIPGAAGDGFVDGHALKQWVDRSRFLLSASDRADIGDEMIGQLLSTGGSFAPEGWPPRGVAEVVEATASAALESGLRIGLSNGRGVTTRDPFEGGKQEHDLASRFNSLATANQEWSRTSRVLRSIAEQYNREALNEDRKAQWLGDGG